MKHTFPPMLKYIGFPVLAVTWVLALRLIWEQTVWSWSNGPQMIGFSLMHSGLGLPLVLLVFAGLLWVVGVAVAASRARSFGGKVIMWQLITCTLGWCCIMAPYGFWQRMFIWKYTPERAPEFFTYAATRGDLKTVKAFLEGGVSINAQTRGGTALHGAAASGELEVIDFLLRHGADVNAINAYGDTPLTNAVDAKMYTAETQALLIKHGAKLVRGSEEQRARVIREQVRKDNDQMFKEMPK